MQLCYSLITIALIAAPMCMARPATQEEEPIIEEKPVVPTVDCADKPDGFYTLDEQPCSNVFFACTGGFAEMQMCATPNLRFDTIAQRCNYDVFVEACGGESTPIPVVEEKKEEEPAQEPVPVIDCKTLSDGFYTLDEQPCSNVFFSCTGGIAEMQMCATPELRFDTISQRCDFDVYVEACGGESTPIPTEPIVQEEEPLQPTEGYAPEEPMVEEPVVEEPIEEPKAPEEPVVEERIEEPKAPEEPVVEEPKKEEPIIVEEPLPEFDPTNCANGYDAETNSCFPEPILIIDPTEPIFVEPIVQEEEPLEPTETIIIEEPVEPTETIIEEPVEPIIEEPVEPIVEEPLVDPTSCANGYDAETNSCFPEEPIQEEEPLEPTETIIEEPVVEEPLPEVNPATCANGYDPATRSCVIPEPIQEEEPVEIQPEEPLPTEPVEEPVEPEVDPASCDNGYNPDTRSCCSNGYDPNVRSCFI